MASASRALLSTLLRQIDRHPVGVLDEVDLEGADRRVIDRLLASGILRERAAAGVLDDLVLTQLDGEALAISVEGDVPDQQLDPRTLRQYDLDVGCLAEELRRANSLGEAAVEHPCEWLYVLGEILLAGRRTPVGLGRNLYEATVAPTMALLRGLLPTGDVLILAPSVARLSRDTRRRLEREGIQLVAIEDVLAFDPGQPFRLDPERIAGPSEGPTTDARLIVDRGTHFATLDGEALNLARREFATLIILARAAAAGGGIATKDELYRAISPRGSWSDDAPYEEQIAQSISLLRKELRAAQKRTGRDPVDLIETRRKVGYRLRLEAGEVVLR